MKALFWHPVVSTSLQSRNDGGPRNRRPSRPPMSFFQPSGLRGLANAAVWPHPENPVIVAPEGLLAKHRGTPEPPANLFLLVSLLAGAGSPKRSGAQPQGGRVRGASARRALETDRGDGTSPANWFSPALAGADFWGPTARSAFRPPLGDWMCAKRCLLTSQARRGCAGSLFSAHRAARIARNHTVLGRTTLKALKVKKKRR